MFYYIYIDTLTNTIKNFCSWTEKENADAFPVEENCQLIEILEEKYIELKNIMFSGKKIKVTNLETLEHEDLVIDDVPLEQIKLQQINLSKKNLEDYLSLNPIPSICHGGVEKKYSITRDKQALLTQMIMITQMSIQSNIPYQPSWNAAGEQCSYDWTIAELQQLAFQIESVVRPLVSHQQKMEADINAGTTKDEVMAISITF
jgi:hypothetical protein